MDSPKYNRTLHLPWSPGGTSDDKRAASIETLLRKPIIITEKMDGSNTSLEANGCFARTHSGAPSHISFDGLKALHATIKRRIPQGVQLFGEWCYALHSIAYSELPGYFMLFNVRELIGDNSFWMSWAEVRLWAEEIEVPTVPVLFEGSVQTENELKELTESLTLQPSACGGSREGIVVRCATEFSDDKFSECVMKWVRKDHVQTDDHWKNQEIIKNKLKI